MDEEIIVLEEEAEVIEEIEIAEVASVAVDSGTRHSTLVDKDIPGSHTIGAISGLQEELDKIETPRVIESNMPQQADYYKWEDENNIPTYPIGIFVSLSNSTGNICPCDGNNDVFGVTVEGAGFVGNQAYTTPRNGEKIGRDSKYNLVAHSGVVAVQKQTNVAVGDYVVPDDSGKAKKVESGKYGYLVTGLSELYGESCAVISLSAPSTIAKNVSDTLYDAATGLVGRMASAETDIGSLTNYVNNIDEIAKNNEAQIKKDEENINDIYDKVNTNTANIGTLEEQIKKAIEDSTQAKVTAEGMRSEAVASANDAVTRVDKVQKEINALDYIIEPHSIGKYSQAYGLTYEQAKAAVPIGNVHIPMPDDSDDPNDTFYEETYYGYKEVVQGDGSTKSDTQKFSYGYYYTWRVDERDGKIKWMPSSSTGIKFSSIYQTVNQTTQYVVAMADILLADGTVYLKEGDVLYWNGGEPEVVTSTEKSGFSRAVNYLRKDAYGTSMEITNARGDYSSLSSKLDAEGAKTAMVSSLVTKQEEGKPEATYSTKEDLEDAEKKGEIEPTTDGYYCVGDKPPYNVYEWDGESKFIELMNMHYDGVYFCYVNTASIINAVNRDTGESSTCINADRINFTGYSTFISTNDNGSITSINGGLIQTGTIEADQINTSNLRVKTENLDGTIEADQINTSNLRVKTENLDGIIEADKIEITNDSGVTIFKADVKNNEVEMSAACIKGDVVATKIEVDSLSAISSNLGTIQSGGYNSGLTYGLSTVFSYDKLVNDKNEVIGIKIKKNDNYNYTALKIPNILEYEESKFAPVIMIADSAFYNCQNLTSVVIPDSVTSIGSSAFNNCKSLTSITIPDSVTSIGEYAFSNCVALINITIPKSITSIEQGAFYSCSKLTSIEIPDSVTSIGYEAFWGCESLTNITIPNSVTSIGERAFWGCSSLESIVIPSSVTSIGNYAFGNVSSSFVICCEAASKPEGWVDSWNGDKVVYYKNDWYKSPVTGLQISSGDKYIINSRYFNLSSDGDFESTGNGKIAGIDFKNINKTKGLYSNHFTLEDTNSSAQLILSSIEGSSDITTKTIVSPTGIITNSLTGTYGGVNIPNLRAGKITDMDGNFCFTFDPSGSQSYYIQAQALPLTDGQIGIVVHMYTSNGALVTEKKLNDTVTIYYCLADGTKDEASLVVATSQNAFGEGEFKVISTYEDDNYLNWLQRDDRGVVYVRFYDYGGPDKLYLDYNYTYSSDDIMCHGHFVPFATQSYDLGAGANKCWRYAYLQHDSHSSDRKIKDNIIDINAEFSNQLINGLNPKSYTFKTAKTPRVHYGFIAQEVEELLHSLGTSADEVGLVCKSLPNEPDGENNFYSLNYINLIAPMVSVIQQLLKRVTELEDKLNTQQNDCNEQD